MAACDALDGASDGLIANPASCDLNIDTITCLANTADTSACLTKAEDQAATRLYAGPRDPQTGAWLTASGPLFGSELNWAGVCIPIATGTSVMSTQATLADFAFTQTTPEALRERHRLFDATNTDLSAFAARGGKLIVWHGLADPHMAPAVTVSWQQALQRQMGNAQVQQFERLYPMPLPGFMS